MRSLSLCLHFLSYFVSVAILLKEKISHWKEKVARTFERKKKLRLSLEKQKKKVDVNNV